MGKEILNEECNMVNALGFNIASPTIMFFLHYFITANECDDVQRELAHYVAELALLEVHSLAYNPSKLAAASVLLTNRLLSRADAWPLSMKAATEFVESELDECMNWLKGLREVAAASRQQAIRKKYSHQRHRSV